MATNPATEPTRAPASIEVAPQSNASIVTRLRALGPGLIYTLTVLGTGDIVSNSAAGGQYGYSLLWALALTLVFRFVWVNSSAKYVLVTGETIFQGYGRLGNWIIWVVLISIIVLRHFYNLYLIAMMGSSWNFLFDLNTPWSSIIWSLFFVVIGYWMMTRGGYNVVELSFKILAAIMGVALIIAAALSKPVPGEIIKGIVIPTIPGDAGLYSAILVLMALIGTEAGSMTNVTYPYFMYEKGWRNISFLKQQRFDLAFGVVCIFIMGALLQIAAAGTVKPLGIQLKGPEHLVEIFSQTLGWIGRFVFAFGLWAATFTTYVGATAGYGLMLTDICRSFIPRFKRPRDSSLLERDATTRDPIYRWAVAIWAFSPIYIIFTNASPVFLVLTVSSLVVVLIPILAFALLCITNDRKLMGAYKNGIFTNVVMSVLIVISLYFTYLNAGTLFRQIAGALGWG